MSGGKSWDAVCLSMAEKCDEAGIVFGAIKFTGLGTSDELRFGPVAYPLTPIQRAFLCALIETALQTDKRFRVDDTPAGVLAVVYFPHRTK